MNKFDKKLLDEYVSLTSISLEKHPTEDLFIYGYHSNLEESNIIWDEYNKHCRGLIIDSEGNVHARPFYKFFTYRKYINENTLLLSENQTFSIPDQKFKIFEKVDGTMTTLYWANDMPFLATQRSFTNPNAKKATEILYEKYSHTFSKLNRDRTYIFEAVFPETNVLIDYGDSNDLYLIGVIDNETSENLPLEDIGFPRAKEFTGEYGNLTNFEEIQNLNLPNQEGFVIVYDNGERIKVKFPWYKDAHFIMNQIILREKQLYLLNRMLSKKLGVNNKMLNSLEIWSALKNKKNIENIFKHIPETFFSVGVDFWINDIVEEFKIKFDEHKLLDDSLSETEIWNQIKPKEIKYFNFEFQLPSTNYSTPMWNRINRLKKIYV